MNRAAYLFGFALLVLVSLIACGSEKTQDDQKDAVLNPAVLLDVAEPADVSGVWTHGSAIKSSTCQIDVPVEITASKLGIDQQGAYVTVTILGYSNLLPWAGEGFVRNKHLTFTLARVWPHPVCPMTEQYSVKAKFKPFRFGQLTGSAQYVRSVPASCVPPEGSRCEVELTFDAVREVPF